ncbi:MAG: OB-fold nucleic acid binding domain-containing protein, partial [Ruminiclostridium sp.]
GAIKNGVPEETAIEIFEDMSSFATYAFNKSHAAAYAFLAYQTAYLRCHYYKEYMVALMTSVLDQPGKVLEYISDLKAKGIAVLPPDINRSEMSFSIEDRNIRYGLLAIKNIGRGFINDILRKRSEKPFSDIVDFIKRMQGGDMNKRALEALIKAGAFDSLPHNRRQLLTSYEHIYDSAAEDRSRNLEGQLGFFDYVEESGGDMVIPEMEEFTKSQLMKLEKEAFGFYATGHPLDGFDKYIRLNGLKHAADITGERGSAEIKEGARVSLILLLTGKKMHITKNNKQMCFAAFEDGTGEIEGIVFDDVYAKSAALLSAPEMPLLVYGTVSLSSSGEEQPKIIVNRIEKAENLPECNYSTLFIRLASTDTAKISQVAEVLRGKGGSEQVRLAFSDTKSVSAINNVPNVNITKEIMEKLTKICGKSNIIVK